MSEEIPNAYLFDVMQVLGSIGEWFRRLTAADSGVLYEDTYLQVRCRAARPSRRS